MADEVVGAPFGRINYTNPQSLRVDFADNLFEDSIAAHGYRILLSRAANCPCLPQSIQLTQADPTCDMCEGSGYFYYGPPEPQDLSQETLDSVQQGLVDSTRGFLIRGLMTSLSRDTTDHDKLGAWERGACAVTTVADNKLYYRDRLIMLDTSTLYREVAVMPAPPAQRLPLRYLVHGGVLLAQSTATVYRPEVDFTIKNGGFVFLGNAPPAGTRISVCYNIFTTYVVTSLAHNIRQQQKKGAMGIPLSPEGPLQPLPLMAQVQMEFIPHATRGGVLWNG